MPTALVKREANAARQSSGIRPGFRLLIVDSSRIHLPEEIDCLGGKRVRLG